MQEKFKLGDIVKISESHYDKWARGEIGYVVDVVKVNPDWLSVQIGDRTHNVMKDDLTLVERPSNDITKQIKTFNDAYRWCKVNARHMTALYDYYSGSGGSYFDSDTIAYIKLKIITYALNEGWTPKCSGSEQIWIAYYCSDKIIVKSFSSYVSVCSIMPNKLFFKSEHLARYAAQQFKYLYMQFCS